MVAYAWSLWDDRIPTERIVEPGATLCFSARWEHKGPVIFESLQSSTSERMVRRAWDLLSEADVVVHYNGSKFDIPVLNQEFILHDLTPPSPFKEVDLLKVVRKRFRFHSNKLDYVAQRLGLGSKVDHKGMDLWKGCMAGDARSWKTMRRYNIQDVVLLRKLYHLLLPWIPNHPNHGVYEGGDEPTCRNCGSTKLQSRGYAYTTTMVYRRFKCTSCGAWGRGRKAARKPGEGILV
jgi:hypothetical protein